MQSVLTDEFGLTNTRLIFSQEEYEQQRDQFGPSWRNAPGLLRQAINTVLDDYLTPMSVFKNVELVHSEILPANFATPLAYRAAIREKTKSYLSQGGEIEFLPIELPDNNPINGETVQDNWLFFVNLPWVYDVGFWVMIPRRPDDGVLPYVYTSEL
ncbi:MAG: hypothetical protein EAZ89_03260 [Bacteroidetes bacterium]|nr:MAG: hypothetical protein EAZ89_03260 [Bacteroidota bacterium]